MAFFDEFDDSNSPPPFPRMAKAALWAFMAAGGTLGFILFLVWRFA